MKSMLAALALLATAPALQFDVRSGEGLTLSIDGVPLIRGSWFQVYEPNWTKGYYSSLGQTQSVKTLDDGSRQLSFADAAGLIKGSQTYRLDGTTLVARYRYEWKGDHPVKIEMAAGMLWAPAFESGRFSHGGAALVDFPKRTFTEQTPSVQRRFALDTPSFTFDNPLATISVQSTSPLTLFDARNYGQDWARGRQLWWLGGLGFDISKDKPLELEVSWKIEQKPQTFSALQIHKLTRSPGVVELPDTSLPGLVPKPRTNTLDFTTGIAISGKWSFDPKPPKYWKLFEEALARRFEMPEAGSSISVHVGIEATNPGEYRLQISVFGIDVSASDDDGLRTALYRLAALAYVRDGKLLLPIGVVADEPRIGWRGVHLFVGPKALEFHKKLWERVLLPMGFNKVVLQCEQTAWKALPGTETPITMSREELKKLFDFYRSVGVEPIPLIQSFGHMEWFFRNGKNLDLASNQAVPYTLDVRKPAAQRKIEQVWEEAIALLKPRTIHFGCDEVDMRGFGPNSAETVTQMWERHLPFLGAIAKRHNLKMMIWGDNALAPGEAIDATHGASLEHAKRRRAAIPKGSLIADWHYRADSRLSSFLPSLKLWKSEGYMPIAGTWYREENIKGFFGAAAQEKAGVLQTTWAGYESSEENMLKAMHQFGAMVVAAEHAWQPSGKNAAKIFRDLYFQRTSPLVERRGTRFWAGKARSSDIGQTRFSTGDPLQLASRVLGGGKAIGATVPLNVTASSLRLALSTRVPMDEGTQVATVKLRWSDGEQFYPIIYGRHVLAVDVKGDTELAPRLNGVSAVLLDLPIPKKIVAMEIQGDGIAGLTLHGVSAR